MYGPDLVGVAVGANGGEMDFWVLCGGISFGVVEGGGEWGDGGDPDWEGDVIELAWCDGSHGSTSGVGVAGAVDGLRVSGEERVDGQSGAGVGGALVEGDYSGELCLCWGV